MATTLITVLISGSGTNLQALINACDDGTIPNTRIVQVISDRKDAYGLKRAETAGIPIARHGVLPYKKQYPDTSQHPQFAQARQAYDADLAAMILANKSHLVVCAGFMRIVSLAFLEPLQAAGIDVINLHPSMHGDLVGAHCIERAWEEYQAGPRIETGIMIHYVIAEVDLGQPILEQTISIEGCTTLDDLESRIHAEEHKLIVRGTRIAIDKRSHGPR